MTTSDEPEADAPSDDSPDDDQPGDDRPSGDEADDRPSDDRASDDALSESALSTSDEPAAPNVPQAFEPADRSNKPYILAGVVTVAAGAAIFQAFRPDNSGQPMMLIALGGVYAILSAYTVWWLRERGEMRGQLTPHRGDITFGAIVAVGMYLLAVGVHVLLTSRGSPKEAWLIRVYLQIGDPQVTAAFYIGPLILLIAAAEELVWRGLVLGALADKLPPRRALLVTTVLYTLAHASTMYLLRDPYIGWNPLVVAAAFGYGLAWGWIALATGRLSLSMVAHALFTWSVVEFPIMNM